MVALSGAKQTDVSASEFLNFLVINVGNCSYLEWKQVALVYI